MWFFGKKEKNNNSNYDFIIENGILVKYNGNDVSVVIPEGVTSIGYGDMSSYSSETNDNIFSSSKMKSITNCFLTGFPK